MFVYSFLKDIAVCDLAFLLEPKAHVILTGRKSAQFRSEDAVADLQLALFPAQLILHRGLPFSLTLLVCGVRFLPVSRPYESLITNQA